MIQQQTERFASTLLCTLLLSACATTSQPPPAAHAPKRPAAARPAAQPVPAPSAPQVPAASTQPVPVPGVAPPSGAPASPLPPATGPATEWSQLASYQKSPFQVFALTETQGLFTAAPGAVGVYAQAGTVTGPIRLRLAVRPDSPVRLSAGVYTVQLQLGFEYTERRACKVASCNGEIEESLRRASKTVRLQLTPQRGYVADTTVPLAVLQSGPRDSGYDVSYSAIVLKVRRLTFAPMRR
uniref:Uncharacterized protein n=1 Tax=uncultured bacterium BLR18 TaxID=506518 RepID=C0INM8_9BACT|nr:hypothetical protein AKSOIL_0299 [uncultured bacterium BLR18]